MLLVVLASFAVALAGLQLGRTPWAEKIRADTARYIREHPRPIEVRKPAAADRGPRRRSLVRQYLKPFAEIFFLAGVPGSLTFLILRRVGRRR